ncbi:MULTISPECIES: MFS transporter [Myroides]|uniref:MFS transporter n=1 Tax=Myroides albus TaxID=2562892 RepID=A0A6I3LNN6_9FLAO|nr:MULTISPECIES: MFS transporter [Myroides]MTG98231.1 MFS transporter [Myroides albus]MVX36373.1 MFS transporter [Myroides sp. LoEW2-1]
MTTISKQTFSTYDKFVIFILSITQFTIILDFMVMAPLGDLLLKDLHISPKDFGIVVSAYAFSAGTSGLLTAGFADKFDRKKLLLLFYFGFIIGTFLCGLANSYLTLVMARIITGLFGGVIGSISMAIVTDLFSLQQRGRVMGFVQMGFGASQVLGIPIGLYIANKFTWEAPFFMIVALSLCIAIAIVVKLKPVNAHLLEKTDKKPLLHLWHTIRNKEYRIGFLATVFLSVGGFMMMPFGTIFAVNNLGVHPDQLPFLFMVSGTCSLVIMPFIGRLSDAMSKYKLFVIATLWMLSISIIYTNLFAIPLWLVMILNVLLMIGIMSRMVPSQALTSAVPMPKDRGAFMSINSSIQQISGGIAAAVAGFIVYQDTETSPLMNYNIVGYVVAGIGILGIILMGRVNKMIAKRQL